MQSSMRSIPAARTDQDFHAAVAAAQAGVDDYLNRLNLDGNYFLKFNTDSTNPALSTNPAHWPAVPGPANEGRYHYQLLTDPATVSSSGALKLRSTGMVRDTSRTVEVTIG